MNGFWQQNIASGEENRRFTYVHNRAVGGSENPGALCVELRVYVEISWKSRCNSEITV